EVEDLKMAEYMVDKVGLEFEAIIMSITNFGMFVQVEDAIEGLVHLSSMKNDYYEFNERSMILIGQRTGQVFRIGEKIKVKLVNVNNKKYDIEFEVLKDNNNKKKKKCEETKVTIKQTPTDHKKTRNLQLELRGRANLKRSKTGIR